MRFDLELERMKRLINTLSTPKKSLDITLESCHINIRKEESFWCGGIFIERSSDWPHAMAESFCTFSAHIHDGNTLVVSLVAQHKNLAVRECCATTDYRDSPPPGSTERVAVEVKNIYMMWLRESTIDSVK